MCQPHDCQALSLKVFRIQQVKWRDGFFVPVSESERSLRKCDRFHKRVAGEQAESGLTHTISAESGGKEGSERRQQGVREKLCQKSDVNVGRPPR